MKIASFLYILIFFELVKSTEIKTLIDKILNEVNPSHVTIHSDFKKLPGKVINNHCSYQTIFEHIMAKIPTKNFIMSRRRYEIPKLKYWYSWVIEYHRNITAPMHFIIYSEQNK